MVGMMLKNGESTVKLLDQNHAGQFVGQCHLSQGQRKTSVTPRFFAEAVAATNGEQQRYRVQLLALQKLGQLFGGKLFSARIEENQLVVAAFPLASDKIAASSFNARPATSA